MNNLFFCLFIIISLCCKSQNSLKMDCEKCDTKNLSIIEKDLNCYNLNKLFCTYEITCNKNIEFTEYFNEVLFKYLQYQPLLFIEELDKNYKRNIILNEITKPISDEIEIDLIYRKISNLKVNKSLLQLKVNILNKLKT